MYKQSILTNIISPMAQLKKEILLAPSTPGCGEELRAKGISFILGKASHILAPVV